MMKNIKFLVLGIFFAIVLSKVQAISWFRFYEMFKFQSFHMYGIIGSAVTTGILLLLISKKLRVKTIEDQYIKVPKKATGFKRYIIGGSIFGLGWALAGACPGPMYILVGTGVFSILIVIAAAILGTYSYGVLKDKLPH